MKLAQQENDLRFHHERNVNETVSRSGTEYKGKRVVTMFLVCQISFPGNWPVKEGWKQTKTIYKINITKLWIKNKFH